METFVYAVFNGSPFVQWRDIGAADVLYLAPWILLIWLLVPKQRESQALRVQWRKVLLSGISVVGLGFLSLVAFYVVSGT